MNETLFNLHLFHAHVVVTSWKLIGFVGTFLFTARWFVQFFATRRNKRVTVPMSFWYLSVTGSFLTLAYFVWGKNDSVGIIQTAFPMFVSIYNVVAHLRTHKAETVSPGGSEDG